MATCIKNVAYRDTIDKSKWPIGPWSSEPDEAKWIDEVTGYRCLVKRNKDLGSLCGYVGIPAGHLLYEMDCQDRVEMLLDDVELHRHWSPVDVLLEAHDLPKNPGTISVSMALKAHCGLTFAGRLEAYSEWFFGFDCGHYCDVSSMPMWNQYPQWKELWTGPDKTYRDMDYVMNECRQLASRLKARE